MSNRKKIRFIINPISGIGRKDILPQLIKQYLDHELFDHEICYTTHAGHARELAREAVDQGCSVVAAVGGDGSVNEVASSLVHTQTAMAIIPAGSGNGLARHLQIPMQPEAAIKHLNTAKTKCIDTGLLNEHFFVGTAGVGFDAYVAQKFDESGKRGAWNYIRLVLREYRKYQPATYKINCDGESFEQKALLLTFANSAQWGNNAFIAPAAKLQDGLLCLCMLERFSLIKAPLVALRLFRGTLNRSGHYSFRKGKHLVIQNPGNIAHVDGEPIQLSTEAVVKIQDSSLFVIN